MANDNLSKVTSANVVIEGVDAATGAQAVDGQAIGRAGAQLTQYVPVHMCVCFFVLLFWITL